MTKLTFALFLIAALPQSVRAAEDTVWKLEQKTALRGNETVWIRKDAVKIQDKNTGLKILMQAPDWKVYAWNDKAKLIYATSAALWKGLNSNTLISQRYENSVFDHESVGVMNNLKTTKMYVRRPPKAPGFVLDDNDKPGTWRMLGNYWTTDAFGLPAVVCNSVERFYGVPLEKRFPVQFIAFRFKPHEQLTTLSCTATTSAEASFKAPLRYKNVTNEQSLLPREKEIDLIREFTK